MTAPTRIMSYNIRKGRGHGFVHRPDRVLQVIAGLSPDIALLQEADHRLGDRPAALPRAEIEAETGLVPLQFGQGAPSLGWHGNTMLLRPDIDVTDIARLDLPGLEPRGAVMAELALPGGPLRVVGLHLGLLRHSRRRQLTEIITRLAARDPMPTLIAGDFNEWSDEVGLGRLARAYEILSPGKTFHARRPVASLDRFAFNDLLHWRDAGVADDLAARRASDHLPIWIDVVAGAHGQGRAAR
ncbi:MAG: metal-dependent hydrolase [Limimaricola sp.]|uniref:endonuclease/exonuclease/phosphatase family protein n=1 Tax=Limimaricola sp. TaxID=2211665 RepID=UPI001E134BF5|nr:endonuclease/exonuclease/phosphatase family protein [Limimaricola sp.]MBI1418710.1 metal-dependent hydrolase [Limimaricola sp.]